MYTGIVQGAFEIAELKKKEGLHTLSLHLPGDLLAGLTLGASVALDGVCLTVVAIENDLVFFDVMRETLNLTTLGELDKGAKVNIERSAKQGAEIGGHPISGHVDGTVKVVSIDEPPNNYFVCYEIPGPFFKYFFRKGFIALNGCSLTIADVDKATSTFQVCYIPETLRNTTHGMKKIGERVNFEIDRQTQVIVDTVESILENHPALGLINK